MTENQPNRCTPESQGIASSAISAFVDAVEQNIHELHSFLLLRHGQVVAEGWWSPYAPERPHMLFSLSKSFASTGIGLAVAEGRLSVDDPVISFFPEYLPEQVSDNLAKMRVRHLLTMATGHQEDSSGRMQKDGHWIKNFLALDVEREPGSFFVYNSGATYMLSAIVQKVTGMPLVDYLTPRLFEPLGIKDATWDASPEGISIGGWGLWVKTEDIARFGQMYLNQGVWNGQRILPEAWVKEATALQKTNAETQTNSDWTQGYGYQFWRCRHNAYRGDGAFGQYCIVMPDQDAVLAITSGVADMQAVLDLVWTCLLPAMQPQALPEAPADQAVLAKKLAALTLQPPQGQVTSPLAETLNGQTFVLEANPLAEKVTFDFGPEHCKVSVVTAQGMQSFSAGWGQWEFGRTALFLPASLLIAASAAWTAPETLLLVMRAVETPFYFTLTCDFSGDQVTIKMAQNVSFGMQDMPPLVGRK